MRNIILFIVSALCMHGCDFNFCMDFTIQNKTSNRLEFISFNKGVKYWENTLDVGSRISYTSFCDTTRDFLEENEIFYYKSSDSTQVKINDVLVKTYYYNDNIDAKSLYKKDNREFWKLVKHDKYTKEYVFEITEEDLK